MLGNRIVPIPALARARRRRHQILATILTISVNRVDPVPWRRTSSKSAAFADGRVKPGP